MTIEEQIEYALLTAAATAASDAALPAAWPNKSFDPAGAAHVEIDHLPNANQRRFLDGTDPHFRQGILQLTVRAPLNAGKSTATAKAGALAAAFPADRLLFKDDARLKVQRAPDLSRALEAGGWWEVVVSVRYECFA